MKIKNLKKQHIETRRMSASILEENALLVSTGEKYLKVIARLTKECEKLKNEVKTIDESGKLRKMAEVRETVSRKELNELKSKLDAIKSQMNERQKKSKMHEENEAKNREEIDRLMGILGQLKKKLGAALQSDGVVPFEVHRTQLLEELLEILTTVTVIEDVQSNDESIEQIDRMTPLKEAVYQKGKVGIAPRQSTKNVLKFASASYKAERRKSIFDAQREVFFDTTRKRVSLVGCAIIDVDDDAARYQSCDSIHMDDEERTPSSRKPSMIQMSHDMSSDKDDDNDKTEHK